MKHKTYSGIFIYDNIPSLGAPGGVARYFRHVRDGLIAHFGEQAWIYTSQSHDYGSARRIRALPENFKGSRRLGITQANYLYASWVMRLRPASFFYSPYFGNVDTTAAQVFTVYDMIHELYFSQDDGYQSFIEEKRRCMERAELLISISESTARDIVACYPQINPDKIKTIWLGVSDLFFYVSAVPNPAQKPYFLYVGARKGYKNFQRAAQALGQAGLAKEFDLRVISPDKTSRFNQEEIALLRRFDLEASVDLRLGISEDELRESYAGATAPIYPSEYEGFGLPVLEAMAAGTVVVASNAGSIPEIAGDIALYFNPLSVESIAETLWRAATLPAAERRARIARGIIHARQFTWARCQQQTVAAISQLA